MLTMGGAAPIILVFSVLATLWVAWRCWRLPPFPGRRAFVAMQLAVTWWIVCVALEGMAAQPARKVFWAEMAWLGLAATPSFWALFVWSYVGAAQRETSRALSWAAAGIAFATWAVALTNDQHQLVYRETRPLSPEPGAPIDYVHGPWYFAITIYLYATMLATLVLLIGALRGAPPLHRRQYAGLLLAAALPWAADISYVVGGVTLFGLEPAPFTFPVMGVIVIWLIARRRLFLLPPIVRTALLDAVPDPVLVLDQDDMIVELNEAARRLAGELEDPIGKPLAQAPLLAELVARLPPSGDFHFAPSGAYYEARSVPLRRADRLTGRLLLLRDVTDRKRVETSLQQQLQQNVALQERLREQATRDALTDLHNRHFCDEVQPRLLASADVAKQPLAAVLLDLDGFKQVNDTHGHQVGDEILVNTARLLRGGVRPDDYIFRFGGEEFLILLPGATAEAARQAVERWRETFAAANPDLAGRPTATNFSAGIAVYPDDAGDWDELLRRADAALYRAKQGGRNRTVCWRDA